MRSISLLLCIFLLSSCLAGRDKMSDAGNNAMGAYQPNGVQDMGVYSISPTPRPTQTEVPPTATWTPSPTSTATATSIPTATATPLPILSGQPGPDSRQGLTYCVSNYALSVQRFQGNDVPHIYLPNTRPRAGEEYFCDSLAIWQPVLAGNYVGTVDQDRLFVAPYTQNP